MAATAVHQHRPRPLNPEPSDPDERAQQKLPPKSYADAVEEEPPKEPFKPETNGASEDGAATNGTSSGSGADDGSIASGKPQNGSTSRKNIEEPGSGSVMKESYRTMNGSRDTLTSVKPTDDYEAALRLDKMERKRRTGKDSQLVSGRRAGAGWDNSSIRFAPLNVPLKRRLQMAAIILHTLSMPLAITMFFWLCAIPLLWPILLPYLIYLLFSNAGSDGTLKRRKESFRRSSVWSLFASYFPARLHRTQELPATRKYIFGYHPHGIIAHGAWVAFATEALGFGQLFPGIINTLLTLDSNFRLPLFRDYALRMGLGSASRESCENLLSKGGPNGEGMGRAITLAVGGARESLMATPGMIDLVLSRRKGFVKLAIRTGADLVPVLAFGENDIYDQVSRESHPWIHRLQLLFKKFMGFTVPLFHARGIFNYDVGLMPYRRPINIVVGRPVMVRRQEKPDPAYVDEIHAQYVRELVSIWDEWKDVFAKERDRELAIVE